MLFIYNNLKFTKLTQKIRKNLFFSYENVFLIWPTAELQSTPHKMPHKYIQTSLTFFYCNFGPKKGPIM
jgi:hypothetical protein